MADTETVQTIVTLPVVPLPDAVLLPGTVATLTLDSVGKGHHRQGDDGLDGLGVSHAVRLTVASVITTLH